MCGITGFIQKKEFTKTASETLLITSSTAINHRGPDDYAQYIDSKCALAIRRLAILDLHVGLYPFVSDDGCKVLVFNGEIYNFWELRNQLEQFGFIFKTKCDAEVILKGFEKWGNEVFNMLRGMFAVAIWDKNLQQLTLVRDRIGIKPLYYIDTPDLFAFSSEAKSFFALDNGITKPVLDYSNVELLLGFMFLPKSDETVIKNIKKLPPATILQFQNKKLTFTKFWDVTKTQPQKQTNFKTAVEQLDTLLVESVKIHMLSDAPLGVLLSGGIDSSLVTAIMTKIGLNSKVATFTAKFDHKFNESDLAKSTADYLGTLHNEVYIDVSKINKNIEQHINTFDDLTSFDGGVITTKLLCEQVGRSGTKVLLLGEGADEIFGGYSWYGLAARPFSYIPRWLGNVIYYYAISRNLTINFFTYYKLWTTLSFNESSRFTDITNKELSIQLPNHLLMKVDKGSMAQSIEARVPYLDHKLVEFVYSLPQSYKYSSQWYNSKKSNEKYILREVAKKYLPQQTAMRKKKGFMLPMHDVLYQDISKVKSYILSSDAIGAKFFSKKTLEQLFKPTGFNFLNMQNEYFLWRLFILEVWAKHFNLK